LPKELLEGMYARLRACEIRMDEGDMFESEVITFVAPKLSGWLKKKSNGMFAGWKVSSYNFNFLLYTFSYLHFCCTILAVSSCSVFMPCGGSAEIELSDELSLALQDSAQCVR
jgi:hypothetical protein